MDGGMGASPIGTLACVRWIEGLSQRLERNDLPTMIIHGTRPHPARGSNIAAREDDQECKIR